MFESLRRLLDPARRTLETRLKLAMSAGRMAAWEVNLRTGKLWWSDEMYALHGRPAADGTPSDYYALVHEEDRERLREHAAAVAVACSEYEAQYRVVWPDGAVHWIEGFGTTLCDDAGKPEVMIGLCVNIDARKEEETNLEFLAQASAELAVLSHYQETMQRIAKLAVPHFADWCAVDMLQPDGTLRRVAVAHVDPEKVKLGMEFHERYPAKPSDPGGTWKVIRTASPELVPVITDEMLEAGIPDAENLAAIRSLGLHSYMAVPLQARRGVLGVISFFTSESRRVFTQRELRFVEDLAARAAIAIENAELMDTLRTADAAKDVFLATLAHELRNPLAPISNSLALLRRTSNVEAVLPQTLDVMQRQTAHLTRLVDDLLDLARINSGKIDLRREVVDLRNVLRTAIEASQPVIDRRAHAFVVELAGGAAWVDGDAVRLAQVFSNLLNNAAKYTPAGGRIELRMAMQGGGVQVTVRDTGLGIGPEFLPRIFEIFTQVPHSVSAEGHGLGIGLYLVKRLVQMHGGSVRAESAGQGQGSVFTVTLPCVEAPVAAVAAPDGAATTTSKRVLVVDDNADSAQTLADFLELIGHTSATAQDGKSALRMVEAFGPDVVLLDIGLPDIDGYEVARRIRASSAVAPRLVALTGWGQPEDKQRAAAAGFNDHWTKPVNPEQLEQL